MTKTVVVELEVDDHTQADSVRRIAAGAADRQIEAYVRPFGTKVTIKSYVKP